MAKVLIAGQVHDDGLAPLAAANGIELVQYSDAEGPDVFAAHVAEAEAILLRTQPLPAALIDTAPKLQIVSRHGVGYDQVDVAALNARGIPLAIVGDVNSRSVAEHALMLMLATAKRMVQGDQAMRAGDWTYRDLLSGEDLFEKEVLIVGFGRIGRHVAGYCRAFGMRVRAHDPYLSPADFEAGGAEQAVDLDDALATADFVSLHVPSTGPDPLISAARIARMRETAILINTSRGSLVDERALADALAAGRLAGAGTDVFATEPPDLANPLLSSDRIHMTPHNAGLTRECASRMAVRAAQNILDHLAGRLDPAYVVNASEIRYRI